MEELETRRTEIMTVFKVESEEMFKRQTPAVCQHQDRLQSEAPDHFIQTVHFYDTLYIKLSYF